MNNYNYLALIVGVVSFCIAYLGRVTAPNKSQSNHLILPYYPIPDKGIKFNSIDITCNDLLACTQALDKLLAQHLAETSKPDIINRYHIDLPTIYKTYYDKKQKAYYDKNFAHINEISASTDALTNAINRPIEQLPHYIRMTKIQIDQLIKQGHYSNALEKLSIEIGLAAPQMMRLTMQSMEKIQAGLNQRKLWLSIIYHMLFNIPFDLPWLPSSQQVKIELFTTILSIAKSNALMGSAEQCLITLNQATVFNNDYLREKQHDIQKIQEECLLQLLEQGVGFTIERYQYTDTMFYYFRGAQEQKNPINRQFNAEDDQWLIRRETKQSGWFGSLFAPKATFNIETNQFDRTYINSRTGELVYIDKAGKFSNKQTLQYNS